ncbi:MULTISPECIES: hypothetical protein [unclassified Acinetobacter]|uniref:hypothetical protein n=1 Tax=unclassified Acinetobacter TaxID=196816 RepID=UPI001293771D|nr:MULTISPECIES: hypothetical protein [unclassified Acinetobacter]MDM1782440.1 hypothetical protein [Acinetobacter indicus]
MNDLSLCSVKIMAAFFKQGLLYLTIGLTVLFFQQLDAQFQQKTGYKNLFEDVPEHFGQ